MTSATTPEIGPATETPSARRRAVYLIDREYQLREVNRGITLFVILLLVQVGLYGIIGYLERKGVVGAHTAPLLYITAAFGIPIALCMIYSRLTIRHTHKVAGAAWRLHQDLPNLITNPAFRFRLRRGDYLGELMVGLNRVMEVQEARHAGLLTVQEQVEDLKKLLMPLHGKLTVAESETISECLGRLSGALEVARAAGFPESAEEATLV